MKAEKLTTEEINFLEKIEKLVENRLDDKLTEVYDIIGTEKRPYYQRIIVNKLIDDLDEWFQGYWDCVVDMMPDGSDLFYKEMDCVQDHFDTYIQGIKSRFYKN